MRVASGTGGLVIERGRVVELCPAPGLPNLLSRGAGAPIEGGDRLWPAPEVEIFYEPDGTWRCPAEIDPGSWAVHDGVMTQRALGARFERRIAPLETWPTSMPWAGYTTDDAVDGNGWAAWHVVMVPAPARMFVRGARDPLVYYPPASPVADGWVEASGREPRWKLGFAPPEDGRAVLAAIGPQDPGPIVVVVSNADPRGTYVDVPPGGGRGTALQLYDDGGAGFCELEHHAPLGERLTSAVVGAWGSMRERLAWLEGM